MYLPKSSANHAKPFLTPETLTLEFILITRSSERHCLYYHLIPRTFRQPLLKSLFRLLQHLSLHHCQLIHTTTLNPPTHLRRLLLNPRYPSFRWHIPSAKAWPVSRKPHSQPQSRKRTLETPIPDTHAQYAVTPETHSCSPVDKSRWLGRLKVG